MRNIYYLLLAVLLLLLLAACGESQVEEVESSDTSEETVEETEADVETEEAAASEEESESEEEKVYGIGETVSIDGMEVTIDRATWVEASEYMAAENGNVLRLEVSFHNKSAESGYVDNTEFSIYDGDGNIIDAYYGSDDADTNMFSIDLKEGKNATGALEYDTGESEFFEVYYEPMFTFKENAEVEWKINSSDIE
ncbi:DUF4352 domain-containing protein [Paraliobacillus sediminis]|uniref:DUF4352 domain-containing protein n=1 Tax=Paraliobacillus sediminis TaxID=1885916 RepID=UPI000E3B5952|nr:DUF4352 domain-containing protein [Paraliobacillus sediminis]